MAAHRAVANFQKLNFSSLDNFFARLYLTYKLINQMV